MGRARFLSGEKRVKNISIAKEKQQWLTETWTANQLALLLFRTDVSQLIVALREPKAQAASYVGHAVA